MPRTYVFRSRENKDRVTHFSPESLCSSGTTTTTGAKTDEKEDSEGRAPFDPGFRALPD
jgi:hypothetical protein